MQQTGRVLLGVRG